MRINLREKKVTYKLNDKRVHFIIADLKLKCAVRERQYFLQFFVQNSPKHATIVKKCGEILVISNFPHNACSEKKVCH